MADTAHLNTQFYGALNNFMGANPNTSIVSGYRSPAQQAQLYAAAIQKYGSPQAARQWVAPPGRSMHNKGLAVDLGYGGTKLGAGDVGAIAKAHATAEDYGLTFPLSNENWHIEPIGGRNGTYPSFLGLGNLANAAQDAATQLNGPSVSPEQDPNPSGLNVPSDQATPTQLRAPDIAGAISNSSSPRSIDASLSGLGGVADSLSDWGSMPSSAEHQPGLLGNLGKAAAGGLIGGALGGPIGLLAGALTPTVGGSIKNYLTSGGPTANGALNGLSSVADSMDSVDEAPSLLSMLTGAKQSTSSGLTAPSGYGGSQSQFAPSFSWSNLLGATQNPFGGTSSSGSYVAPGYTGMGGGHSIY